MTQHHHTPPPDPMPLDPEERALAARLARLGPHGEPSPALDARVLAAAHAATTAGGARAATRRHGRAPGAARARWPVGVGVAASVVLAAGIAWQMRPSPAPPVHASVAPAPAAPAMRAIDEVPATHATDAVAAAPVAARAATTATGAPEAASEATVAPPIARTLPATAKALAPPPEEPRIVFDAPSPVDAQAPPPAPPAPPAPIASSARAAKQAMQSRAQAPPQAALPVFDAAEADSPEGDVPPATAASPEVRDAWLARIRELAVAGRTDEARASLSEFQRRYPAFAIPEDLQPLTAEPASPPPGPARPTTP